MARASKKARIVTIGILVCALGVVIARRGRSTNAVFIKDPTAQDAIYAMLDAAREGDVGKYVASYGGSMESSLKQAVTESADFGKYLRDSNAAIKGVAIMDPEQVNNVKVKARVEYVFQDRNEVQYMYLDKTPGGWKIVRVDSAERVKTLVPYGTPVR
jgi:hypothetical protein